MLFRSSGAEPSDCWDPAFHRRANETPQSIVDPCAEERTFACKQILLSHKWLIALDPIMRFPLESTAGQWVLVFQLCGEQGQESALVHGVVGGLDFVLGNIVLVTDDAIWQRGFGGGRGGHFKLSSVIRIW